MLTFILFLNTAFSITPTHKISKYSMIGIFSYAAYIPAVLLPTKDRVMDNFVSNHDNNLLYYLHI